MAANLPTLDFAKFLLGDKEEKEKLAEELVASFAQHGFAKLVNHSIPDEIVDDIWEWACLSTPHSRFQFLTCITEQKVLLFECSTEGKDGISFEH